MMNKRKSLRVKDQDVVDVDSNVPGHTHYKFKQDTLRAENLIGIQNIPTGRNEPKEVREISLDQLNFDKNAKYMVVYDPKLRKEFLDAGFVGEPVGVGIRKSDRQFQKTKSAFTLSSYEIFYAYDELKMIDTGEQSWIQVRNDLIDWGKDHDPDFKEKYSIYRALREKGFIVLDGSNYGMDFAIYPETIDEFQKKRTKDHGPILIQMRNHSDQLSVRDMVKSIKLADRIRKDFIIMKAKGRRNSAGHLTTISDDISAYMIDVEPMGVDRYNDINAIVMRKLTQSNSYNVIDIEIKKERY